MYDALIKVSTGFKLVYYGLVLIVLAVVVGMVGAFALGAGAAAGGGGRGAVAAAGGLGLLVGGMAVTGSVVGLIGRFMCLAVPDRAGGAKSKIVVSVALEVVSLLISLANLADDLGGNFLPAEFKMVGSGGGLICSIIAAILFLLFARDLALYIRRSKLADDAMSVLRLWVAAVGCYIAGFGILLVWAWGAGPGAAGGGAAGMACAGGLLALAGLVIAIIALISYARLLIGMSDAVRKYAGKVRYGGDEDGEDGFDDEDDRPRRRRRRDDDEDEDDDRPRRRRRRDEDEDDDRWER